MVLKHCGVILIEACEHFHIVEQEAQWLAQLTQVCHQENSLAPLFFT